jgi:hypothetical protein
MKLGLRKKNKEIFFICLAAQSGMSVGIGSNSSKNSESANHVR